MINYISLFKSSCMLDNDSFSAKAHTDVTAPTILRDA